MSDAPSLKTPTKNIKLLFLGRLSREKGFEDLLFALPRVLKQWPGAELFACGLGDLPKYRDMCKAMAIRNNVHFLGWVEHEQKINLLGQADIFVLPSHNEGFPVCLLEAMAAGLPVVATNVGGIPDLVEPDKNGILVEAGKAVALADAIINLADDFFLRERMSINNRAKAMEQYDIKLVMRELSDIYRNFSGYRLNIFPRDGSAIEEMIETSPKVETKPKI